MTHRGLQVLAVAFDAGEADAGQFHVFGHREAFLQRFSHFNQVLGIERLSPTRRKASARKAASYLRRWELWGGMDMT